MSHLAAVINASLWTPKLEQVLSTLRPWVDEIVIVTDAIGKELDLIDPRFQAKVIRADGRNDSEIKMLAIEQCKSNWLLWLHPNETIDDSDLAALREIALADPSLMPICFSVECRRLGVGAHSIVDMEIRDEVRFHQRVPWLRFEGRLESIPSCEDVIQPRHPRCTC